MSKLHALLLAALLLPAAARSDIAANCTITPSDAFLLDGSIPPQAGVEIFVYAAAATGVEYTFACDVTEQPAAVVVLPAEMQEVVYDAGAGKLTVTFTHLPYIAGSNVPAPPGTTTFSIALVPAAADGSGPPPEMRGAWMATNIPPVGVDPSGAGGWELIAPSENEPFFGYQLNGPEGSTGVFQMFIPESMRLLLEQLINQDAPAPVSLEWSDLAIFNDNQQASLSITPVEGGGALVDILVEFAEGVTDVPNAEALSFRAAPGGPGGPPFFE